MYVYIAGVGFVVYIYIPCPKSLTLEQKGAVCGHQGTILNQAQMCKLAIGAKVGPGAVHAGGYYCTCRIIYRAHQTLLTTALSYYTQQDRNPRNSDPEIQQHIPNLAT